MGSSFPLSRMLGPTSREPDHIFGTSRFSFQCLKAQRLAEVTSLSLVDRSPEMAVKSSSFSSSAPRSRWLICGSAIQGRFSLIPSDVNLLLPSPPSDRKELRRSLHSGRWKSYTASKEYPDSLFVSSSWLRPPARLHSAIHLSKKRIESKKHYVDPSTLSNSAHILSKNSDSR